MTDQVKTTRKLHWRLQWRALRLRAIITRYENWYAVQRQIIKQKSILFAHREALSSGTQLTRELKKHTTVVNDAMKYCWAQRNFIEQGRTHLYHLCNTTARAQFFSLSSSGENWNKLVYIDKKKITMQKNLGILSQQPWDLSIMTNSSTG